MLEHRETRGETRVAMLEHRETCGETRVAMPEHRETRGGTYTRCCHNTDSPRAHEARISEYLLLLHRPGLGRLHLPKVPSTSPTLPQCHPKVEKFGEMHAPVRECHKIQ